jgi:hypothetical protein
MSWLGVALGIIAIVLVCLTCKYDPAIRLREWMDGMDREPPDE